MEITIEGKRFVTLQNGTFAHDIWLTKKIREAGLANVAIKEGETEDDFIDRIAKSAFESGEALNLLGGLLIPADTDARAWTPELAQKTSEFFGNVTDPASKQVLRTQIASALFYFFVSALVSSKTSPKFGAKMTTGTDERHATEDASASEIGVS